MKYDNFNVDVSSKNLDLKEIELFEIKNKFKLPDDYKDFILQYNGGFPEKPYFYCDEKKGQGENLFVKGIFDTDIPPISFLDLERIKFEIKTSHFKNRDFLPIAMDCGNNYICIFVRGEHYNKVCFWSFGNPVTLNQDSALYYLTNTFTDFINQLTDCEDE